MKAISIIIPNTNSLLIGKIIHQLKQQTVDMSGAEILVVGVDEPRLVIEDNLVRFIPTESPGYASDKRNLGMQLAKGEILFFLDDDCFPAINWVEKHLGHHLRGEEIVGGSVTFDTNHYLQLADNISAFHELLPTTSEGYRTYLCTANLSVAQTVVNHGGFLRAHKNRAEDLEWTVRLRSLGYKLYFEPQALIAHHPNRFSLIDIWKHWFHDAPETISVRLQYAELLQTPYLAHYRLLFLWGAPLIAGWATARVYRDPQVLTKYWYTLPIVYLTKLIWCWGAYVHYPINC